MNDFASAIGTSHPACDLIVRPAVAADLSALSVIHNWAIAHTAACFRDEPETKKAWEARWSEKCATHPWFVAEARGAVIGYTLTHALLGRCGLSATAETSVYVAAEHQGRGVGTALYRRLIEILKTQGYASLIAAISLPNPASERLHEAFGYRRAGTLARVGWKFGRWHDVGFWQLVLSEPRGAPPKILTAEAAEALIGSGRSDFRHGEHFPRDVAGTEREIDER